MKRIPHSVVNLGKKIEAAQARKVVLQKERESIVDDIRKQDTVKQSLVDQIKELKIKISAIRSKENVIESVKRGLTLKCRDCDSKLGDLEYNINKLEEDKNKIMKEVEDNG